MSMSVSILKHRSSKDWPFFTNYTDLVKTCIWDSKCDRLQDIIKNLGKKLAVRVGLLTVSDRASRGEYPDESGPEMARMLQIMADDSKLGENQVPWPLAPTVVVSSIVPDDTVKIQKTLIDWIDSDSVDLVLTSGGTGFGVRDYTPEAIKPLLHREAPGISQALLAEGLKFTPLALLSRPIAGTRNNTFICTLPGSVKAIRENIGSLKPLLPRIIELVTEKVVREK